MSGSLTNSWETFRLQFPDGPIIIRRNRNNLNDYSIAVPPGSLEAIKELRAKHENYADLNLAAFLIKLFGEDEKLAEPLP